MLGPTLVWGSGGVRYRICVEWIILLGALNEWERIKRSQVNRVFPFTKMSALFHKLRGLYNYLNNKKYNKKPIT